MSLGQVLARKRYEIQSSNLGFGILRYEHRVTYSHE